jgi:NAD-dependent dihydropyrimidine dehydrogenase PreA subunit
MSNIKNWNEGENYVEIDLDLCNGSGECMSICPVEVYELVDNKVNADNIGECIRCGACEGGCPNKAILKHWAWK